MKSKPLFGVTRSVKHSKIHYYCTKFALGLAGAKTLLITAKKPHLDRSIDGLILSGGIDLILNQSPSEYLIPLHPEEKIS